MLFAQRRLGLRSQGACGDASNQPNLCIGSECDYRVNAGPNCNNLRISAPNTAWFAVPRMTIVMSSH